MSKATVEVDSKYQYLQKLRKKVKLSRSFRREKKEVVEEIPKDTIDILLEPPVDFPYAFEDALENLQLDELPDLDESIAEARRSVDLFLNNKYAAAMDLLQPWSHVSIYHALGKGTMLFMQAMLTMEVKEIEKAADALRQAIEICNRRRKKHNMNYVSKMVKRPNYNSYKEEEVHAELCYAECLLLVAILTFVEDQSLVNFVRGSLRIRSCYNSYKECMHILETRKWDNELRKRHFESGVRMGVGAFNLMISQLPTKVLKLLEFIGFSGNKNLGLKELHHGYAIKESLRSPLCALTLVSYHTLVTYIFGNGDGDVDHSERILVEMLERYPQAALFIFLSGRVKQLRGQIDDAIVTFQQSIDVQQEWRQFHYLCFWELLWCHSFKCDWEKAAACSDILRRECKWSPAIYNYVYGSMLCMMMDEGRTDLRVPIIEVMGKVPGLKQRVAGKSIPLEKYVVRKSQKFFDQDCRLLLPALELLYIWNSFPMIKNSPQLTEKILCLVDKAFSKLHGMKDDDGMPLDDYCLALLLRGVCYKNLGRPLKAEDCLREVISCEKRIKQDIYLVPFAMAELGHIKMEQGLGIEAKELFEPARHNYHGYPLETLLHFRVHSSLRQLRAKGHLILPTPSPTKASSLHSINSTCEDLEEQNTNKTSKNLVAPNNTNFGQCGTTS